MNEIEPDAQRHKRRRFHRSVNVGKSRSNAQREMSGSIPSVAIAGAISTCKPKSHIRGIIDVRIATYNRASSGDGGFQ